MSPSFNPDRFRAALSRLGSFPDRPVLSFDELDSTSTEVRRQLKAGAPPGIVVVADRQTAGRGRQGRTWHSPDAGNLYLSFAFEVRGLTRNVVPLLPLVAGVSAVDAIRAFSPVDCRLKWPNDILVNDRKLAGLLLETSILERERAVVIAGLGVNIGRVDFPEELVGIATSLGVDERRTGSLESLSATWIHGLETGSVNLGRGGHLAVLDAWRERAEPFGRAVRVGDFEGTTIDLADDGRLILDTIDRGRIFVSGGIVEHLKDAQK